MCVSTVNHRFVYSAHTTLTFDCKLITTTSEIIAIHTRAPHFQRGEGDKRIACGILLFYCDFCLALICQPTHCKCERRKKHKKLLRNLNETKLQRLCAQMIVCESRFSLYLSVNVVVFTRNVITALLTATDVLFFFFAYAHTIKTLCRLRFTRHNTTTPIN